MNNEDDGVKKWNQSKLSYFLVPLGIFLSSFVFYFFFSRHSGQVFPESQFSSHEVAGVSLGFDTYPGGGDTPGEKTIEGSTHASHPPRFFRRSLGRGPATSENDFSSYTCMKRLKK
jgi:hypothetical protein